jgi:hypothetical protein
MFRVLSLPLSVSWQKAITQFAGVTINVADDPAHVMQKIAPRGCEQICECQRTSVQVARREVHAYAYAYAHVIGLRGKFAQRTFRDFPD